MSTQDQTELLNILSKIVKPITIKPGNKYDDLALIIGSKLSLTK